MSSTNPVGSSTGASAGTPASPVSAALNINSADFLRLITTQLQAQNPLQPSDPTQFLSQLEGLSQVSSLQSVQSSLSSLQTSLQSAQLANGASLLGQSVLAPSTTATLSSCGGTVTGAVAAPSDATRIAVTVTDSTGALVDSFQLVPAASGLTNFTWKGTHTDGTAAAAGQYTIAAISSNGTSNTRLTPLIASKVQSVTVDAATQGLDVNTENGTVPLTSVVSIL
jgi:flagellar basal-body rod modification protein FlgD